MYYNSLEHVKEIENKDEADKKHCFWIAFGHSLENNVL